METVLLFSIQKYPHGNFLENHVLMWKGKLLEGCCRLFHRSVYQDFDYLSMIPISATILILQLFKGLSDVTKNTKRINEFDFTDIQDIC